MLDPWHGSGTTSLVAARNYINTIGCEINPVMNIFAVAKCGYIHKYRSDIYNYLEKIIIVFNDADSEIDEEDPLLDFMSNSLCVLSRSAYQKIEKYKFRATPMLDKLSSIIKIESQQNAFSCFFKAALFITVRKLAGYKGGSNPTWVKKLNFKPTIRKIDFIDSYRDTVKYMLLSLLKTDIPESEYLVDVSLLSDSRTIDIQDSSIDAVITSPPYLTRIDYAMATRPELLIMMKSKKVRKIRENTIGAPVIVDKNIEYNLLWGNKCFNVINGIKNHSTKAAKTYYLPNTLQYFRDIELSLKEVIRVLKKNGEALIVVQSSYFKDIEIDLGNIYVELLQNLNVKSEIVKREIVRGHLAHVNTKSSQYVKGKVYFEDIVYLKK